MDSRAPPGIAATPGSARDATEPSRRTGPSLPPCASAPWRDGPVKDAGCRLADSSHASHVGCMEQVTILVHGTFANPGYDAPASGAGADEDRWWRLPGRGGEPGNMADKLQQALGTVWEPGRDPRDGDLSYRDIGEWSGKNTHKARIVAARNLARGLEQLAHGRGCRPEHPLQVNFVAHSHGGNVVLECLKHMGDNVKPRQLCLLGTPLTWRFADLRIVYLPVLAGFLVVVGLLFYGGEIPGMGTIPVWTAWGRPGEVASQILVGLLLLPLPLWFSALGITVARRASVSVAGIRMGRPAYGPRPKVLEARLRGRPAVLWISQEDEADLMLQLGAAPLDTYRAMVVGRPSLRGVESIPGAAWRLVLKYLEFAYLRPFAYVIVVPALEVLLERVALGFPLRQLAFTNLEMVTWVEADTYDWGSQVTKHRVSASSLLKRNLKVGLAEKSIGAALERRRTPDSRRGRVHALRKTVFETLSGLKEQVHLRHSGYYTSPQVIDEIANTIAAPDGVVRPRGSS